MLLLPTPPVSPTSNITMLADETEGDLHDAAYSLLDDALARVLERISDDSAIRMFVEGHCYRFAAYSPDAEHELEWTDIHVDYCSLVERVMQDELSVIGCTEESLLDHLMRGDPLADRRLSRLLAKTDFFYFCAMMQAYDYASRCLTNADDGDEDEVGDYILDEQADAADELSDGDDEGLEQLERCIATTAVRDGASFTAERW